jgi:hypothetical protein
LLINSLSFVFSEWGELSESIAVRIGDALEDNYGLRGFLDVDDLTHISLEAIREGILASRCVLVLLNDQTLQVSGLLSYISFLTDTSRRASDVLRSGELLTKMAFSLLENGIVNQDKVRIETTKI